MRLVVENKDVTIKITPAGCCMNPVFELSGAPGTLARVQLGGRLLDGKDYAWDGKTLWVNAPIPQPTTLELVFTWRSIGPGAAAPPDGTLPGGPVRSAEAVGRTMHAASEARSLLERRSFL